MSERALITIRMDVKLPLEAAKDPQAYATAQVEHLMGKKPFWPSMDVTEYRVEVD